MFDYKDIYKCSYLYPNADIDREIADSIAMLMGGIILNGSRNGQNGNKKRERGYFFCVSKRIVMFLGDKGNLVKVLTGVK